MSEVNNIALSKFLSDARIDSDLAVEDAAKKARVNLRIAKKLELGAYKELEHNIYTVEALKRYAKVLNLDPQTVEKLYLKERGQLRTPKVYRQRAQVKRSYVTSKLIGIGTVLLLSLGVAFYLLWQLKILAAPPHLEVIRPNHNEIVQTASVQVHGVTDPGAEVFINNSPVVSGEDGDFRTSIMLNEGLNIIKVEARSKSGKANLQEINVVHSDSG